MYPLTEKYFEKILKCVCVCVCVWESYKLNIDVLRKLLLFFLNANGVEANITCIIQPLSFNAKIKLKFWFT